MVAAIKDIKAEPLFHFGVYRHYKGGLYTAYGIVRHHDSGQKMVVYMSHEKGTHNVRPLSGWAEDPDGWTDKVINSAGKRVDRFAYLGVRYEKQLPLETRTVVRDDG